MENPVTSVLQGFADLYGQKVVLASRGRRAVDADIRGRHRPGNGHQLPVLEIDVPGRSLIVMPGRLGHIGHHLFISRIL